MMLCYFCVLPIYYTIKKQNDHCLFFHFVRQKSVHNDSKILTYHKRILENNKENCQLFLQLENNRCPLYPLCAFLRLKKKNTSFILICS
jgi:hypothetical protein